MEYCFEGGTKPQSIGLRQLITGGGNGFASRNGQNSRRYKSRDSCNWASLKLADYEDEFRFLLSLIKIGRDRNPRSKNRPALLVTKLNKIAASIVAGFNLSDRVTLLKLGQAIPADCGPK
jgi:hypothetical protein